MAPRARATLQLVILLYTSSLAASFIARASHARPCADTRGLTDEPRSQWSTSPIFDNPRARAQCRKSSASSAPADTAVNAGAVAPGRVAVCYHRQITVATTTPGPPAQKITVENLMPVLQQAIDDTGVLDGVITVCSRHTTTALSINEYESRLVDDLQQWLLEIAPIDDRSAAASGVSRRYLHNDIHLRPDSDDEKERCRENGWDIDDPSALQAWRNQEPINAHSHLMSMLLGSSESIPIVDGAIALGQWQSLMLVDLDGPRDRTVAIQVMGWR